METRRENHCLSYPSRLVDVLILLADDFKLKDVGAISAKEPKIPKLEIIAKLAKEAGHSLDSNFKCFKCSLQINTNNSIVHHQASIHMKCLGGKAQTPNVYLHSKPNDDYGNDDFDNYHYSNLLVHKSHCMATHGPLQLRFCTFCGAYGKHRSTHLKLPCPPVPSKAGIQALQKLQNDVNPGLRKDLPRGAQAKAMTPRKCSLSKLRKAREAYI